MFEKDFIHGVRLGCQGFDESACVESGLGESLRPIFLLDFLTEFGLSEVTQFPRLDKSQVLSNKSRRKPLLAFTNACLLIKQSGLIPVRLADGIISTSSVITFKHVPLFSLGHEQISKVPR
ncbi:uncharacterized protein PHALS_02470 [Plasmopara halstedii]|uniref:Uncharacterized protein n=1 Tax=Plasmopara halstedii TaxID=4781 RepID=A0A0P1A7Z1_PLAHL|nr:uncharacterized protein PHALS_02470 [Plasmopara halstedii]CEG36382.1 hypothetical protein PHALS_02470 [Plasmopara halstedii]|eukprot:XP_024572751.1 hypothetical protein PHALS_02470 [Plasmopara halstedii]